MTGRRIFAFVKVRGLLWGSIVPALSLASASFFWAGVNYDVSVGLPVGDDSKVFLNITNEYYAPPQPVATALVRRCPHPEDDYPTVLFLAQASGRPPGEILDLRLRGESWSAIMVRERVPPSALFVGIDRDPGPPYGHAWGYWRSHPRGRFAIEDHEFVELTKLQVASRYYHAPPCDVAAERRRGGSIERYAADRHREHEHGGHGERHEDHGGGHGEGRGPHHDDRGSGGHGDHSGRPHGNPHDR